MLLLPVISAETIVLSEKSGVSSKVLDSIKNLRDVTQLPVCAEIASAVSRLLSVGLTTEEVEDDICEVFDFLEDCVIRDSMIFITVITDTSNFQWED